MVNEFFIVAGIVGLCIFLVIGMYARVISAMHYSYSNARSRVMVSRLLSKHKVDSYCDMEFSEIVSDLEESAYGDLISMIGDDFSLENIHYALNVKSGSLNKKLLKVVPSREAGFFKHLLSGLDFNNVRVLLRLKHAKKFGPKYSKLLVPTDVFDQRSIEDWVSCSVEDLKVKLRFTQFKDFAEKYLDSDLVDAEFYLDVFFYSRLLLLARKSTSLVLIDYSRKLVDLHNVKNLASWSVSDIESGRFIEGGFFSGNSLLEFKQAKDLSHVSSYLKAQVKSLTDLRVACEKNIASLGRSLLLKDPLSVNSTLAYHILKDSEILNLKRILKLKFGKFDSASIRGLVI